MTDSTDDAIPTPEELRIKVGVYDDPTSALEDLFDDPDTQALQLHRETADQNPHVTLKEDGSLWGIAENDDGETVEGPMDREHLMAGLANVNSISIVSADAAPFSYEVQHPSDAWTTA